MGTIASRSDDLARAENAESNEAQLTTQIDCAQPLCTNLAAAVYVAASSSDDIVDFVASDKRSDLLAKSESDSSNSTNWKTAACSTLASISIVMTLLLSVRLLLPPLLESSRYSWYRGQLRAEHEAAGEQLQHVSLDGLGSISALVSQRVTPAVVHIDVRQRNSQSHRGIESLMDPSEFSRQFAMGQGSGVIVDPAGYILTNFHVLEDADDVEVHLSDRRRLRATVVGSDPATDLAVLKVDADNLIAIDWGDSERLTVGSPVWAVGSPFGLSGSITFGIISSKHRMDLSGTRYQLSNVLAPRYGDLLQSDVAVNPGNSGGPLVDGSGSLIGINTAILGESYRGVSFSIPSRVAKRCYEQIRATGKVERGWLGVELQMARNVPLWEANPVSSPNKKSTLSDVTFGAKVMRFADDTASPAKLAGVRIGDLIVEFNSSPVIDANDLIRIIGESDSGVSIPFTVLRDGKTLPLNVVLTQRSQL